MDIDSTQSCVVDQRADEASTDTLHNGQYTSYETHNQHQDLQAQSEQEAHPTTEAETHDAWQSQTFQVYECIFDSTSNGPDNSCGIVNTFSTGSLFNTTVGESRAQMGIQDDNLKMTNGSENNFFKALKWSPDGSCLLSSSNDNCMRIFALPDLTAAEPRDSQLNPGVLIREGEVIYDMCWYPGMNSTDPATCCILSSSRDHPVHLWDAYTGELRCSYTLVDHCEVNFAPNALCFNLDGSKIYCGSNNMIQIFDTTRPGKDCEKRPTVPTRKSKKGQKGVISCLAFNPDHSDLYAAGSFLKSIGLYDSRAEELLLLLRDKNQRANGRRGKPSPVVTANEDGAGPGKNGSGATSSSPMGGLTQVQFSPDGLYLYSASRQDPFIRCWDIRNTANVLFRLERLGELTNQRLGFDVSSDGRWLSTGDMNGDISIFDLNNPTEPDSERLVTRIHGHNDVISSAVFHPTGSMLATSSGQRKYELSGSSNADSDSNSDSDSDGEAPSNDGQVITSVQDKDVESAVIDNSISLWTLSGEYVWYVNGQRWTDQSAQEGTTVNGESEAAVDSTMALGERIKSSSTPSGDVVMEITTTATEATSWE